MQVHIRQLQALEDRILGSDQLYLKEEIVEEIRAALPQDFKLFFYMRETRRFTDRNASLDPYLRFPFLSFELGTPDVSTFRTPADLVAREAAVQSLGWSTLGSPSAVLYWQPHPLADEDLVEAVRRVFQVFYHVCGSRQHFVESIARRYVRDFVRDHGREFDDYITVLERIESDFGLEIALGFQRDEFTNSAIRPFEDVIHLVEAAPEPLLRLGERQRFLADLNSSLAKKTANFGYDQALQYYYYIATLTDEFFLGVREGVAEDFKISRRAVLILLSKGERLKLSSINNATRLIDNLLRDQRIASREEPFFKVLEQCRQREEQLGSDPAATRRELDVITSTLLEPFLRAVSDPTSIAENIAVRRYEPGSDTLRLLATSHAFAVDEGSVALSLQHRRAGAVAAFVEDGPVWQYHQRYYREGPSKPAERFAQDDTPDISTRPDIGNSIGDDSSAFHARSIRVGGVASAVIEFSSTRVADLKREAPYFQRIAQMCGEVIRRIELANDRAWLSRMSYVHAARHSLESVIRQVEEAAGEPASKLRALLTRYSAVQSPSSLGEGASRLEAIKTVLGKSATTAGVRICEQLAAICEEHQLADRTFALVLEVLETLKSNSSHAPFSVEQLHVTVLRGTYGPSSLKLAYLPKIGLLPAARLDQVCVSPIRDKQTPTFHFGLFLLAAQLRMIGGAAHSANMHGKPTENVHFGATFLIPMDVKGDPNE